MASEDTRRKNSLETRAHLESDGAEKPSRKQNQWLHLNPRVAALGADAFSSKGPVMITKIHAYLFEGGEPGGKMPEKKTAEFVNRNVVRLLLETFWTQEVKGTGGI